MPAAESPPRFEARATTPIAARVPASTPAAGSPNGPRFESAEPTREQARPTRRVTDGESSFTPVPVAELTVDATPDAADDTDYDPEVTDGDGPAAVVERATAPTTREAPMLLPVSAEERQRILRDPLVAQALDLFDGQIVNMQRVARPAAPVATPDETE